MKGTYDRPSRGYKAEALRIFGKGLLAEKFCPSLTVFEPGRRANLRLFYPKSLFRSNPGTGNRTLFEPLCSAPRTIGIMTEPLLTA